MRELIIKVDDPGERAWDGSSKVFEIKELVRCKDCVFFSSAEENDAKEDLCGHILMKTKPDGYCADGERRTEDA